MWSAAHEKTSGSLGGPPGQQDSQSSVMLLSAVPAMVPRVGHSRVPPITAGQHLQVSLMVLCQKALTVRPELYFIRIVYLI